MKTPLQWIDGDLVDANGEEICDWISKKNADLIIAAFDDSSVEKRIHELEDSAAAMCECLKDLLWCCDELADGRSIPAAKIDKARQLLNPTGA
jgi:hypothetical protein